MEVLVTDAFGLPDDALVSIRYGNTRRQVPLESALSHPLKFPAQLEDLSEPLKIEVLQRIASTHLVLHPHEEHYGIGFKHSESAMGLHVRASGGEPGIARELQPNDSAAAAKHYLEQNGLLKYIQSLLHAVIQDKPQDPFAYMIEQLTAAKSKAEACARVLSRPASAVPSRPSSAARPTSAHIRSRLLQAQLGRSGQTAEEHAASAARVPEEDADSPPVAPAPVAELEEEELIGGVGPREIEGEAEPADEARQRLLEVLRSGAGFEVLVALEDAPAELRADRDIVLKAVESDGAALEYAAEGLRADRDFVLKAVESDGFALAHAAEELRADRDFILKAVRATRADWLLQFASKALQKDEALARRCKEAAGTGLVFTYYRSYQCFQDMRNRFPAAGASVPGGEAYEEVMEKLKEASHGSTATVWFDEQPVFGHAADDGRWTHPSHDCGRDMLPVPPKEGRDAKWNSTVDSRSQSLVSEVGKSYVCWCCRWLREVRRHHERGEVICCAVSNIYDEAWVRKYGAGSSELSDADAELRGLPKETFKNGKPPGWGEGQIRISNGQSFERKAPVHDRTKKPLGVGCRWERQALDNMEFPVYAFFMP